MAFGLQAKILRSELEKLGAKVSECEKHRLKVNDKYEISYTNFYYRYLGEDNTIGHGKQEFLKLIEKECNK